MLDLVVQIVSMLVREQCVGILPMNVICPSTVMVLPLM